MAKTPFKLKSGNATPFKMMGSSPIKYEKKPVGPREGKVEEKVSTVKEEFIKKHVNPYTPPPKVKPTAKSTPKTEPKPNPNISVTNPNIVAEPVTTNVNTPNPNLEIDDQSSKSTIGDVLTLPINVYTNPNKAIRTTRNTFNKGKELINKGKKKVGKFLRKTI
jgi:hypothetical protein